MTDLPSGWVRVPIAEVADVRGGIQKQAKRRPVKNKYPFLRVANVGRGVLNLEELHEIELFGEELERYALQDGDLLVVEGNGSPGEIGRAAMWHGEIVKCVHQNHLICVRPTKAILPRFLELVWNSPDVAEQLRMVASTTSGLYTLSTSKVKRVEIAVPPLAEQRRIVAALEDHLSNLNAGRSRIDASIKRLIAWRSSLINNAISGSLSTRSVQWKEVAIGDLAKVGTGSTPSRSNPAYYEGGTVPWVTSSLLNKSYVDEVEQYVTPKALAEARLRIWPEGTLLMAMYGEGRTRGRCSELKIPAAINQACAAISLLSEFESRRSWVKLVLEATYERNRKLASGGVQPNLNLRLVRSIRIPLPPLEEQGTILAEVDLQLSRANILMSALQESKTRAVDLQWTLLREAFVGRLVAQDPTDEPASALLERVRSERAARGEPVRCGRRIKRQIPGQEAVL